MCVPKIFSQSVMAYRSRTAPEYHHCTYCKLQWHHHQKSGTIQLTNHATSKSFTNHTHVHGRRNVHNIGGAGAGVLGVILPHRGNAIQLCFWGGKCRVTEAGRVAYVVSATLALPPTSSKLSLLATEQHTKPCFDRTNSGYCFPPMGQTRLWTRISENRNVSNP